MDGDVHHFESRGLYEGVSILWDEETGSIWHHITGEALDGPMAGRKMPVHNLLHLRADQALASFPDLEIAMSERPLRGERGRWSVMDRVRRLSRRFLGTMSGEDERRPTMDIGLGVWTASTRRYYPLETVTAAGSALLDTIDGRTLLVWAQAGTGTLSAIYVEADGASWRGDVLELDGGREIRGVVLYGEGGSLLQRERPLQVFTRWYGFALTFPGSEIYEGPR